MSFWSNSKKFTSWLGAAQQTHQSGKSRNKGRTKRHKNKAAHILQLAARTVGRSGTALGAFYRRISRTKRCPNCSNSNGKKIGNTNIQFTKI